MKDIYCVLTYDDDEQPAHKEEKNDLDKYKNARLGKAQKMLGAWYRNITLSARSTISMT